MFCNENLYYLLCSCTNPIFGKILVPEIWAKMFSANQVAGFFVQPYLQNKSMKWLVFLHVDTNSHKLKVDQEIFGWAWPEWVWSVWSRDSKIGYLKNELMERTDFFARWCKFRKAKSYFKWFLGGAGQKWAWSFSSWDLKICRIRL